MVCVPLRPRTRFTVQSRGSRKWPPSTRRIGVRLVAGLRISRSRLLVHDDGREDGFHISAHAAAIVGKDRGDTLHISGTRIAGNQVLNKLPANKGTDVGVSKYVVERALQILLRGLARRQRGAVEKNFLRRVVALSTGTIRWL